MRKNRGIFYLTALFLTFLFAIIFTFFPVKKVYAQEIKYYLGGEVAGFVLDEQGATILSITDIFNENGIYSPGQDSGLKEGDVILSINGKKIENCYQIDEVLKKYKSGELVLELERDNQKLLKDITPVKDLNGNYRLGLIIRDAISGIGTITYTTSSGDFAALGHAVYDNKELFKLRGGKIYNCSVVGVLRGKRGCPGEIKGYFTEKNPIGEIKGNSYNGIKGNLYKPCNKQEIELGKAEAGKASIYSCLGENGVEEYSISIVKCDYLNKQNKNFVIKITDEKLLEKTGGIIQGMSGSPIVQNGKLVGAVTHVFINDPTRGFGISIENMINN